MATGTSGSERTIGQLVADATHDLEGIVRGEIALAKAEVTSGARVLGKGAGLLAGAAFLSLMGFTFILHGAAWGIGEALPIWAGYLIVAAVVLLVAVVLGLAGKKSLETAKPAPERAIDQAQQTIAAIKNPKGEPEPSSAPPTGASTATGATASSTAGPPAGSPAAPVRGTESSGTESSGTGPSGTGSSGTGSSGTGPSGPTPPSSPPKPSA